MTRISARSAFLCLVSALLSACGGGGGSGGSGNSSPSLPALSGTYDVAAAAELFVPASLTATAPTLPGGLKCTYSNGNLPPGMTISGDCSLAGTPKQPGRFDSQILVTATGYSGSATVKLGIDISGPTLVVMAPLDARMLRAVESSRAVLQASGMFGMRPSDGSSFAVTAGKLPSGVSLDSKTGALTGAPLEMGDFEFTVTATFERDGQRLTLTPATGKFTVGAPGLAYSYYSSFIDPVDMGEMKPATPLSPSSQELGPYKPVLFEFVGTVPPGLKVDATTGVITGFIDTTFQTNFVVRVSLATDDGLKYTVDTSPVEVKVKGVLPIYDLRDCLPPGDSVCYVPYRMDHVYTGSNVFIPRAMYQGQAGDVYTYEILPPTDATVLPDWAVVNSSTGIISMMVPNNAERRTYGLRLKVTTQRGGKSFSSIQPWSFTLI